MKKNILINALSIKMGGGLTYLENLLKELPKVSHPFQIFILLSKENNLSFFSPEIDFIKIKEPGSLIGKFLFNQFGLRKILKKYKIDILFQMANYAMFFCPIKQVILLRQSHFFSKIFLKNIYPLFSFKKKIDLVLRRFLIILSVKIADAVLAPSQAMVDDIKNFVSLPGSKIYVNHYGTYLENFSKSLNPAARANKINLLYTSHYWDHKNFGTLFEAIAILDKSISEEFTVLLTIDSDNSLNKNCATFKIDFDIFSKPEVKKHIKVLGKLSYSQTINIYKEADIFLWPTITEAFGHPLIEAMASSLPIVASDIPINREICDDVALYFEPLSPKDFAEKMKLLIENSELRKTLAEKSSERAKLFDWGNHVRKLFEIFEKI